MNVIAVERKSGGIPDGVESLTRVGIAARAARDIPDGAFVNLGIGLPTQVANHIPAGREVFLHSENGVLHVGPAPAPGNEDPELVNAGKQPITLLPGGSYFDSGLSFAMMRGGHLDIAVLGGFEVSAAGDLANWRTTGEDDLPAVGGAMDLACGARQIWVVMEHTTREGRPRIVETCRYPLTAPRVVRRVYTNLAVIDVTANGLQVLEMVPGLSFAQLQSLTGAELRPAPQAAAAE